MIRECRPADFSTMLEVINDAAKAYRGVIPADRWHDPYMSAAQLRHEIDEGIRFFGLEHEAALAGIMGIQDKGDVCLIRHAYIRATYQRSGIGTRLLRHLESLTEKPILLGTWANAIQAIRFYEKNGYRLLPEHEKGQLLRTYWTISERQVETSVVLANRRWFEERDMRCND